MSKYQFTVATFRSDCVSFIQDVSEIQILSVSAELTNSLKSLE